LYKSLNFASDRDEINKLLESPNFLKLADAILENLDRKTLAEIIAAYLYFKARGRKDSEFSRYIASQELMKILSFTIWTGVSVILPAILRDRNFRNLTVELILRSMTSHKPQK
jgi:hypothetical protein